MRGLGVREMKDWGQLPQGKEKNDLGATGGETTVLGETLYGKLMMTIGVSRRGKSGRGRPRTRQFGGAKGRRKTFTDLLLEKIWAEGEEAEKKTAGGGGPPNGGDNSHWLRMEDQEREKKVVAPCGLATLTSFFQEKDAMHFANCLTIARSLGGAGWLRNGPKTAYLNWKGGKGQTFLGVTTRFKG